MSHDSILKTKAVKACSELIELLDVKKNDGWMFVQEENQGGLYVKHPKTMMKSTNLRSVNNAIRSRNIRN